ncbi:MAG: T9SS type A sorting domain-containing protein [Taibaiella sp.]|nr:T9SS type A sorting domain-containing protein [Taibaiella sp.]
MKRLVTSLILMIPFSVAAQWELEEIFEDTIPHANQLRLEVLDEHKVLMIPLTTYQDRYIIKTEDGGLTWTKYELPEDIMGTVLYEADFVNEEVGYIVGGTPFGAWNVILKTEDGGMHWTALDHSFLESAGSYGIENVSFASDGTGYIAAAYQGVYKTTDGGLTFTALELPVVEGSFDTRVAEIKFIDQEVGLVSCFGYRPADSSYVSYILKTTDGGNSWSVADERTWNDPGEWHHVDKIHFVNANDVFAIGGKGYLKVSPDGGESWIHRALPDPAGTATDIFFVNNACGYIVMSDKIYRTDNAGQSWVLQSFATEYNTAHYIQFANDSIGYAAGNYHLFVDPFTTLFKSLQPASSPLSVYTAGLRSHFKIYPNPACAILTLEYESKVQIQSIQLFDIGGKLIKAFDKDQKALDIGDIADGVYFLNIQAEEGNMSEKIIVN